LKTYASVPETDSGTHGTLDVPCSQPDSLTLSQIKLGRILSNQEAQAEYRHDQEKTQLSLDNQATLGDAGRLERILIDGIFPNNGESLDEEMSRMRLSDFTKKDMAERRFSSASTIILGSSESGNVNLRTTCECRIRVDSDKVWPMMIKGLEEDVC
jgi:hypothetical protein